MYLTPLYLSFSCNQTSRFIYRSGAFFDAIFLPPLLATANQMRRLGEAPHGNRVYGRKIRVYEQYTRQDNPMESSDKISQYYKDLPA